MSTIEINHSALGNSLQGLLTAQDITPGDNAGYELCKQIWIAHPLGGKLVEKPVRLALSKPRLITIDCEPKAMLIEAYKKEWDALDATSHIRDVMFLKRTYGAAAIIVGSPDVATTEPLDLWKLSEVNLYFNQFDPLNLAGSIVTNQNPNAPDFQKPNNMITAAGNHITLPARWWCSTARQFICPTNQAHSVLPAGPYFSVRCTRFDRSFSRWSRMIWSRLRPGC